MTQTHDRAPPDEVQEALASNSPLRIEQGISSSANKLALDLASGLSPEIAQAKHELLKHSLHAVRSDRPQEAQRYLRQFWEIQP